MFTFLHNNFSHFLEQLSSECFFVTFLSMDLKCSVFIGLSVDCIANQENISLHNKSISVDQVIESGEMATSRQRLLKPLQVPMSMLA